MCPAPRRVFHGVVHRGAGPFAVWAIKHVVAPVHRLLYRATDGRAFRWGRGRSVLLLTTIGRRTGRQHTTPVFYLRDGTRFVVCNVRPDGERVNPWVLNVRAHPQVGIRVGRDNLSCTAHEVQDADVERYWPAMVSLWPAYEDHFQRGGERSLFVLEPLTG
ncbi:deazaflavin-dependent oxidoreductase (nitroreductase family) [Mycobacterium sp. BK558]|nr:deazaflavin-dependent oxidoreductase (nitroreductase family) [Mycobacterium sp. BK558]